MSDIEDSEGREASQSVEQRSGDMTDGVKVEHNNNADDDIDDDNNNDSDNPCDDENSGKLDEIHYTDSDMELSIEVKTLDDSEKIISEERPSCQDIDNSNIDEVNAQSTTSLLNLASETSNIGNSQVEKSASVLAEINSEAKQKQQSIRGTTEKEKSHSIWARLADECSLPPTIVDSSRSSNTTSGLVEQSNMGGARQFTSILDQFEEKRRKLMAVLEGKLAAAAARSRTLPEEIDASSIPQAEGTASEKFLRSTSQITTENEKCLDEADLMYWSEELNKSANNSLEGPADATDSVEKNGVVAVFERVGSTVDLDEEAVRQDLALLRDSHLEQLENIQVAIKCEISTVLTQFGVRELMDLISKTSEELLRENLMKYNELSAELEAVHQAEVNTLTDKYEEQVELLEDKLKHKDQELEIRLLSEQEKRTAELSSLHTQIDLLRQQLNKATSELTTSHSGKMAGEHHGDGVGIHSQALLVERYEVELREMKERHALELEDERQTHKSVLHEKELELEAVKESHRRELEQAHSDASQNIHYKYETDIKLVDPVVSATAGKKPHLDAGQTTIDQEELDELWEQVHRYREELETNQTCREQLESQLEEVRDQLESAWGVLKKQEQELSHLRMVGSSGADGEIMKELEELRTRVREQDSLQHEIEELKSRLCKQNVLDQEIKELRSRIGEQDALQQEIEELKSRLVNQEASQLEMEELKAEASNTLEKLQTIKVEFSRRNEELQQCQAALAVKCSQLDDIKAELDKKSDDFLLSQIEMKKLRESLKQAEEVLENSKQEYANLKSRLNQYEAYATDAGKDSGDPQRLEEALSRIVELERDLSNSEVEMEAYRDECRARAAAQTRMEAALKQGELRHAEALGELAASRDEIKQLIDQLKPAAAASEEEDIVEEYERHLQGLDANDLEMEALHELVVEKNGVIEQLREQLNQLRSEKSETESSLLHTLRFKDREYPGGKNPADSGLHRKFSDGKIHDDSSLYRESLGGESTEHGLLLDETIQTESSFAHRLSDAGAELLLYSIAEDILLHIQSYRSRLATAAGSNAAAVTGVSPKETVTDATRESGTAAAVAEGSESVTGIDLEYLRSEVRVVLDQLSRRQHGERDINEDITEQLLEQHKRELEEMNRENERRSKEALTMLRQQYDDNARQAAECIESLRERIQQQELQQKQEHEARLLQQPAVEGAVGGHLDEEDPEMLRRHNAQLLSMLSDILRVCQDTELNITRGLEALSPINQPHRHVHQPAGSSQDDHRGGASTEAGRRKGSARRSLGLEDETQSSQSVLDASQMSDEGLDLSQRFTMGRLLASPEQLLDSQSDELVTEVATSLQTAIDKLMERLEEARERLMKAERAEQSTATSLEKLQRVNEELETRIIDVESELKRQTENREQLALQLYKTEGLMRGYKNENEAGNERVRELEEEKERLVQRLETTQYRVSELESREGAVNHRESELRGLRDSIERNMGDTEQERTGSSIKEFSRRDVEGLMEINAQLSAEVRELKSVLETERQRVESRQREAELEMESMRSEIERLTSEYNTQREDLGKQIEALKRQAAADKLFIQEQTSEREQEHEEFLSTTRQLDAIQKEKERLEASIKRQTVEIKELEEEQREHVESIEGLLTQQNKLETELTSQISTNGELRDIIAQLEKEIAGRSANEQAAMQKHKKLSDEISLLEEMNQDLNSQLEELRESERSHIPADNKSDDLTLVVHDLEEEVDRLSTAEQRLQSKCNQLQDDIKHLKSVNEELRTDKESLEAQVCSHLKQISALKAELEQLNLRYSTGSLHDSEDVGHADLVTELKEKLERDQKVIETKDKEIAGLCEQLEEQQRSWSEQTEQLAHVRAELQVAQRERDSIEREMEENQKRASEQRKKLENEIDRLRTGMQGTTMSELTQSLLDDKNEEIDQLTSQLQLLSDQLTQLRAAGTKTSDLEQEIGRLKEGLAEKTAELSARDKELSRLASSHQLADLSISQIVPPTGAHSTVIDTPEQQRRHDSGLSEAGHLSMVGGDLSKVDLSGSWSERKQVVTSGESNEITSAMQKSKSDQKTQEELQSEREARAKLELEVGGIYLDASGQSSESRQPMPELPQLGETESEGMIEHLIGRLQEREESIERLTEQIQALTIDLENINGFTGRLQEDFDNVQAMLESKQRELELQSVELTREHSRLTTAKALTDRYEAELSAVREQLERKEKQEQECLDEKEEELYELRNTVDEAKQTVEARQREIERLEEAVREKENEIERHREILSERGREIDRLTQEHLDKLTDKDTEIGRITEKDKEIERLTQELQDKLIEKQTEIERLKERDEQIERLTEQHSIILTERDGEIQRLLEEHKNTLIDKNKEIDSERERAGHIATQLEQLHLELKNQESVLNQKNELIDRQESQLNEKNDLIMRQESILNEKIDLLKRQKGELRSKEQEFADLQESVARYVKEIEQLRAERSSEEQRTSSAAADVPDGEVENLKQRIKDLEKDREALLRRGSMVFDDDGESISENIAHLGGSVERVERTDGELIVSRLSQLSPTLQALLHKLHSESLKILSLSDLQYLLDLETVHQSLTSEVKQWRENCEELHSFAERERERETSDGRVDVLEKKERALLRQIDTLEQSLVEERQIISGLRHRLEKDECRAFDSSTELTRERETNVRLATEVSQLHAEISTLHAELDQQQHRVQSATTSLEEERRRSKDLTKSLSRYRTELQEISSRLNADKSKVPSNALLEKLQQELDQEKNCHAATRQAVEQQREQLVQLQQLSRPVRTVSSEHLHQQSRTSSRLSVDSDRGREDIDGEGMVPEVDEVGYRSGGSSIAGEQRVRPCCAYINRLLERERLVSADLRQMLDRERSTSTKLKGKVTTLKADLDQSRRLDNMPNGSRGSGLNGSEEISEMHKKKIGNVNLNGSELSFQQTELNELEILRQRLYLLSIELQEHGLTAVAAVRAQADTASDDRLLQALLNICRAVELLMSDLSISYINTTSSSSMVEPLDSTVLLQNAQLCAHVERLSSERRIMGGAIAHLKEELSRAEVGLDEKRDGSGTGEQRDKGVKVTATTNTGTQEDNTNIIELEEEVHRLYGKYLRAESYRKALVYQKKYLLLLIGGFQDCERDTLAMIASMGAYPTPRPRVRRPLERFRTAARAVIATSRLKYLVNRWNRSSRGGVRQAQATTGAPVVNAVNVQHRIHQSAVRNDSPAAINSSTAARNVSSVARNDSSAARNDSSAVRNDSSTAINSSTAARSSNHAAAANSINTLNRNLISSISNTTRHIAVSSSLSSATSSSPLTPSYTAASADRYINSDRWQGSNSRDLLEAGSSVLNGSNSYNRLSTTQVTGGIIPSNRGSSSVGKIGQFSTPVGTPIKSDDRDSINMRLVGHPRLSGTPVKSQLSSSESLDRWYSDRKSGVMVDRSRDLVDPGRPKSAGGFVVPDTPPTREVLDQTGRENISVRSRGSDSLARRVLLPSAANNTSGYHSTIYSTPPPASFTTPHPVSQSHPSTAAYSTPFRAAAAASSSSSASYMRQLAALESKLSESERRTSGGARGIRSTEDLFTSAYIGQ